MGISALANWYVSNRLFIVAKESESIALESDAWHLRTDVYTSLGVFAGLDPDQTHRDIRSSTRSLLSVSQS